MRIILIACIMLASFSWCLATTQVYSLRIRRAFVPPQLRDHMPITHWRGVVVPIVNGRIDNISNPDIFTKHLYTGAVLNGRYMQKHWWIELTTAVAREKMTFTIDGIPGSAARTGLDDIVLETGVNFLTKSRSQFVVSFLAGFPSRRKIEPFDVAGALVGTRLFSVGPAVEASWGFYENAKQALVGIAIARCLHFFSRKFFPILPCEGRFHPGNLTDILVALRYRYIRHVFEIGYDATVFSNIFTELPFQTSPSEHFVRNTFYGNYIYGFKKIKGAFLGTGVSGLFIDGGKLSRGWTWWLTTGIIF